MNYSVSPLPLSNYFHPSINTYKTPRHTFQTQAQNEKNSKSNQNHNLVQSTTCLCASTFLRFMEDSSRRGNFTCYCVFRISACHWV